MVIPLVSSGMEAHNALCSGKRYRAFLWSVYCQVCADELALD